MTYSLSIETTQPDNRDLRSGVLFYLIVVLNGCISGGMSTMFYPLFCCLLFIESQAYIAANNYLTRTAVIYASCLRFYRILPFLTKYPDVSAIQSFRVGSGGPSDCPRNPLSSLAVWRSLWRNLLGFD